MTYYKVLHENGRPCHGGSGQWCLPQGTEPGRWMSLVRNIVPCERGYHLVRREHLVRWLGPTIWIAEGRGEHVECDDKNVFGQARLLSPMQNWNERTARLFACDCAERVLPIFQREHPHDGRLEQTIQVVRRFAHGEARADELYAAWDAAWDAAWGTARGAVRDAARSAATSAAELYAAWAAARSAVWSAVPNAATSAAGIAAGIAAKSAAWDAARSAARDDERAWQTDRLFEYLEGGE